MWKPEHRRAAERHGLRYPSDLTDAEWALISPMIPPARRGGRPRDVNVREVLNADLLCAVDRLPVECAAEGPAAEEHGALLLHAVGLGRHAGAHPSRALRRGARAGRPRSQSDSGDHRQPERQGRSKRGSALDPQGFDAGKKVTGRKRHILVDTLGLLLSVVVHPADIQDRDGARELLRTARRSFPFITRIFADAGYQGPKMAKVVADTGCWTIEIVKRSDAHHFVVCPNDGSSSGLSPGSAATAVWRVTSNATREPSSPSSASQ